MWAQIWAQEVGTGTDVGTGILPVPSAPRVDKDKKG